MGEKRFGFLAPPNQGGVYGLSDIPTAQGAAEVFALALALPVPVAWVFVINFGFRALGFWLRPMDLAQVKSWKSTWEN